MAAKTKIKTLTAPSAPSNRPAGKVADLRRHFARLTAKTGIDEELRSAFVRGKVRLAHTHPALTIAARDLAVKTIAKSLGVKVEKVLGQPVPGGVGYGVFYNDNFKIGWGTGTSFAFDIMCPTPPGGNVNTWLYLTATNRAALGVEAFISYNGQNDTHFLVFDWARTDQWQTNIPLAGLANYLRIDSAHGHPYQVLPVWNSTWRINATTWRNQALLYNHARPGWDLVYQYDYAATDAQQKTGWVGSWGPIVETFQPLYAGVEPLGALVTQLISADTTGHWGTWALLGAANSNIRNDNLGFHVGFLDPNHSFSAIC